MGSNVLPEDIMDSSEDELHALEPMDSSEDELEALERVGVGIPECEGLLRALWNTKFVTLYNAQGVPVGEGTCHSVNSELVLSAHGPLGDTHVSVHISKTHSKVDISLEDVHSLVAWLITLVHCRGASLHDQEARCNFNYMKATRLLQNLQDHMQVPLETLLVKQHSRQRTSSYKNLITRFQAKCAAVRIVFSRSLGRKFEPSENACTRILCSNTEPS